MLQDFPCSITLVQWEACDWIGEGRWSEELRRQRERGLKRRGRTRMRLKWCYQKFRIIVLKSFFTTLDSEITELASFKLCFYGYINLMG